jgi:hypothetical protein
LNQLCSHNAYTKEITDVGKVNVEIPTDHIDVIENSEARYTSYETERAVNSLENELCCSVFNHNSSPLFVLNF